MAELHFASKYAGIDLHFIKGDWDLLLRFEEPDLLPRPDRARLALLVSAACFQTGRFHKARRMNELAIEWGADIDDVFRVLISGIHTTLARARSLMHAGSGRPHYEASLVILGAEFAADDFVQIRSLHQDALALGMRGGLPFQPPPAPAHGITTYAQNFEDVILWRAIGGVTGGFYVDLGAQDPVLHSVSLAFYQHGWRGIHVEPTPAYAKALREMRPDEVVLEVAVGQRTGTIKLYEVTGTGLSTGDKALADAHAERGFGVKEIEVRVITLAEIFASTEGREVHWLKVDVEGMERDVLLGWGHSSVRPWIVLIESTVPLSTVESHADWEYLLLERDYVFVYFDGLNRFYLAKEKLALKQLCL